MLTAFPAQRIHYSRFPRNVRTETGQRTAPRQRFESLERYPALRLRHREDVPFIRDSLENVASARLEFDSRPCDEVANRARCEQLVAAGESADASRDVDRDSADVVAHQLDFAGVYAATNLEIEASDGGADRERAADGSGGSVEGGQRTVAG